MDIEQIQDEHAARLTGALRAVTDPIERIQAVNASLERGGYLHGELATITRDAVRELLDAGVKQAEVARRLGISRGRVNQLADRRSGKVW